MSPATTNHDLTERIAQAFEELPGRMAAEPDLIRRGRFLTCDVELGIGEALLSLRIENGRVVSVARGPFLLKPHVFGISAETEAWAAFLRPVPEPGDHDLLALTKSGRARVFGDLVPFMGNLQYMKDLLALPRNRITTDAIL